MNIWHKIKLWFDPDQRLSVTHMGEMKHFDVSTFTSKSTTKLAGKTVDGRKFRLVSKIPMEFAIIEITKSDNIYEKNNENL